MGYAKEVLSHPPSDADPPDQHVSFAYDTLPDLLLAYRQRKARGIEPLWCVNHGMTLSMYYRDPDGNDVETQVETFETNEEATEYFMSPEYRENPIGVDFDPEEMIARVEKNEPFESLRKRPDIGPRGLDTIPLMAP